MERAAIARVIGDVTDQVLAGKGKAAEKQGTKSDCGQPSAYAFHVPEIAGQAMRSGCNQASEACDGVRISVASSEISNSRRY